MEREILAEEVLTFCALWNEAKRTGNPDTEAALLMQLWEMYDLARAILDQRAEAERARLLETSNHA